MFALTIALAILLFSAAILYTICQQNAQQTIRKPSQPLLHGTIEGRITDLHTGQGVGNASVIVYYYPDTWDESTDIVDDLTDNLGAWKADNVNFTQAVFIDVRKEGYYPREFFNVTAVKAGNNSYDCGELAIGRISQDFKLIVELTYEYEYHRHQTLEIHDGEQLTIQRLGILNLNVRVTNNDKLACLGMTAYNGSSIRNILSLWVYPKPDTVRLLSPAVGFPEGKLTEAFDPLNVPPDYRNDPVFNYFSPFIQFGETGNYTMFISYKDNLSAVSATAYASLTFYVNIQNNP